MRAEATLNLIARQSLITPKNPLHRTENEVCTALDKMFKPLKKEEKRALVDSLVTDFKEMKDVGA